jgi:hypothetical protein
LYTIAIQGLFLMAIRPYSQLEGVVRYVAILFPNFIVLALCIRDRWLKATFVTISVLLQAALLALFIRWVWVA